MRQDAAQGVLLKLWARCSATGTSGSDTDDSVGSAGGISYRDSIPEDYLWTDEVCGDESSEGEVDYPGGESDSGGGGSGGHGSWDWLGSEAGQSSSAED